MVFFSSHIWDYYYECVYTIYIVYYIVYSAYIYSVYIYIVYSTDMTVGP